jgi:hypothetical protein
MPTTFHIRNKITGKYYAEYDTGWDENYQSRKRELKYTDKGWGKSFKEVAKIKMHLLYLTGIFMPPQEIQQKKRQCSQLRQPVRWIDNQRVDVQQSAEFLALEREIDIWETMHPGYDNVPDWLDNPDPLDMIPAEWEIVEVVDKKNKVHHMVDFDPHAYACRAQQLRKLTDNHGSAVRDVYKKLEKSFKLNQFAYVVAVQINPANVQDWWQPMVNAEDVNTTLASIKLSRSDTMRTTKRDSIAIAFKSKENAAWFIMNYFGKDKIALLDMVNLRELVTPVGKEAPIAELTVGSMEIEA